MANLGPRDTSHLVMMTGWDATELQNYTLLDGTSVAQVQAELVGAIGALNLELTSGLWGRLLSFQDRPEIEYRVGSSNGFEEHTEYGRPDSKRAATEGHMLPLRAYDRALAWTWDYLQEARLDQIRSDIADALQDARDIWRQKILTRILQRGDDSGAAKGLGSSGYSPGFATDAGSTSVDFIPPTYGGTAFTSAHEHYVAVAGGYVNSVFSDAKAELREHGHEPPYDFIIGGSDETTVKALTDFTPVAQSLVAYGVTQDVARVPEVAMGMTGVYPIGTIHEFAVYVVPGMPQYYGFGWKSYGQLSQRNPLRVRTFKGRTRVDFQAFNDPRNGSPAHPLQWMMLYAQFGVGVGDRTNGTPRYVNNATWADGTAT